MILSILSMPFLLYFRFYSAKRLQGRKRLFRLCIAMPIEITQLLIILLQTLDLGLFRADDKTLPAASIS